MSCTVQKGIAEIGANTLSLYLMKYEFGKPKDLDSITKEDSLKNKVWIWTWEAGLEGKFNEDWQVPVIGMEDVKNEFIEPTITLQILNSDFIAAGVYDCKKKMIFGIGVWMNESWESTDKLSLNEPIIFEALVKINGIEKVQFIMNDKSSDKAFLKNTKQKSSWKFW